tara:strand:+ start:53 stop:349 length:297 start_codon:yes stop_codon:yes gene_type:complete
MGIPKSETVIERVEHQYGIGFLAFIEECRDEKEMDLTAISKLTECSQSNLRRIFRKFKFNFYMPPKEAMLSETEMFQDKKNTIENILYRRWIGKVSNS